MDTRVRHVIRLIQEDMAAERTLSEMAAEVNLTAGYLRDLFKREIGMTALKYRKTLRYIEAKRLLVESSLPILEIMRRVGISDESHFTRDFRARYGMAPRSYRAEHRPSKKKS